MSFASHTVNRLQEFHKHVIARMQALHVQSGSSGIGSSLCRGADMEQLEVRCLLSAAPLNVVLISDAVAQAQQVRADAANGTISIIYNSNTMTTTGLVDLLASVSAAHNGAPIGHLGIVAHGSPGEIDLGNADDLNLVTLPGQAAALERLRSVLTSDARLDLYSCSVAAGADGKIFINDLSSITGAAVFASDNPVGTIPGADFVWEYHTGQVTASNELLSVQEMETIPGLCLYSTPNLANAAYTGNPFAVSPNYLVGQCTWYAYGRIQEVGLISSSQLANWPNRNGGSGLFLGNASTWIADANAAHAAGFPISTGSVPQVGALAVWSANHVAFVESVSGSTITVTECNNTPKTGANVVVGGTYARLRSTMDASSSGNILWTMPQFTVMTALSGPSSVINGYQWVQLTGNGYTGYAAWLDLVPSQPATSSSVQWNITQFKNSPTSPWITSTSPTYIYLNTTSSPAPSISSLSPSSYPASSSNQTMLINGSNFQSGATLTFHDPQGNPYYSTPSKLTVNSSSQLSYQFNDASDAGTWTVFVTNPDAQTSSTYSFTVTSSIQATCEGVDYSTARPTTGELEAAGYSFVVRYVSAAGNAKNITSSEAQALESAGIGIILVFESTGVSMQGGYSAGVADANTAVTVATAAGAPQNFFCYFACDWDASLSDQTAINAYLDGAASVLGGVNRVGIYGGYGPVSRALDAGKAAKGWQTSSWSGGNIDSRISLYQDHNTPASISGCDLDCGYGTDLGQWFVPPIDTTPPGNITSFIVTPGNGQVSLSWSKPGDSDYAGVQIVRKTGSYPTSRTDGT